MEYIGRSQLHGLQRPDMTARPTADISPTSSSTPISRQLLYPYHQQAFTHSTFTPPLISTPPNLYPHRVHQLYHHRSTSNFVSPPPLPPKPIVYPTINSNANHEDWRPSRSPPPPPLPPPPPQDQVFVTSPTEDSDELAMVLALSQSESVQKKLLEDQLMNQEEEDLARALAASMSLNESNSPYFGIPMNGTPEPENALDTHRIQPSPSHIPLTSPPKGLPDVMPNGPREESLGPYMPHDAHAESGCYGKWRIPNRPGKQQGEALKIEAQPNVVRSESPSVSSVSLLPYDAPPSPKLPVKRSSISSVSSLPYNIPERRSSELHEYSHIYDDKSSSQEISFLVHLAAGGADLSSNLVSPGTVLEFDDAAYARQLAAEEEPSKQSLHNEEGYFIDQAKSSSTSCGKQNTEWHRPQSGRATPHEELYDRQYPQDTQASISCVTASTPAFSPTVQSTYTPLPLPDYEFPPIGRANSYQSDINSSIQFAPVVYPSLRSYHGSAPDETSHNSSPPLPHTDRPRLHLDMPRRSTTPDARRPSQTLPPQTMATTSTTTSNQRSFSSTGVLNVNHFVDRDLLRGVSIGFKGPMISTRLVQMQDPMPNIISLPYTRCPPLHIQAPDWRHLLRLMAQLSGTRMEPTVEAMTISKVELKLRTVIQFVKPHPSFDDWRSVLWFTIDQPIPSSFSSASRYTSGNPNLLPWSYTLSPIPVLLRDASDTNMSKTYTIPATDTIPLPTLPITFPNLALYLQAALDTSRRHISDSPNGLGKLGKMVQTCYPSVNEGYSEYDIPERTGVGHLLKRVIGRSNKDKKKGKGTNNEDTYQLVTPFVPGEWG